MAALHIVALIEAYTVTGPAKNLLRFREEARAAGEGDVAADLSIATFCRRAATEESSEPANLFIDAVRAAGADLDVITERFRFDPRVIAQLREILRRRAPDIVQTHGVKSHFLMRSSGLCRQHKWIAFHHGYTAEDLKMRLYNQLNRWSLPAADRVVTVCRPFAEALARTGVAKERIRVLPNSIGEVSRAPEDEIRELREELGIGPGEKVILSIGRFSREKAQADLIHAVHRMSQLNPALAFRLVLVGDGPERRRVEQAAAKAGLAGKCIFAGHQQDVRSYYGLADLFVLPSHSEGSPNVLLEAMAAGLPIVATAVGGIPETIEDGHSALLAPPAAPEQLAAAMVRLLTNLELATRLAGNAAASVALRFSPQVYVQSLKRIYAELRGGNARSTFREG